MPPQLCHAAEGGAEGTANPQKQPKSKLLNCIWSPHKVRMTWITVLQPHRHHWTLKVRQTVMISPCPCFFQIHCHCNMSLNPRRLSSHPVATSLRNTLEFQSCGCCSGVVVASNRQEQNSGLAEPTMTEPTSASILKALEKGKPSRNAAQASEPTPEHYK